MMTRPTVRRRLLSLALAAALTGPVLAQNYEPFTVQDIRVDGLQRISAGTVFSYLPVERGDMLDRARSTEAIRALFKTGFFSDVSLQRQGDVLVITVVERPAINTIEIEGNKELKTDELMKGLKGIGLAEGETYNPLNLDRVTQELSRQYNNRGKYGVTISPTITQLDRNRVDVKIKIVEGKPARIRDINIVGNTTYTDAQIRTGWESSTSNWLSFYKRDDQYSREKVAGDLEKLQNYYLDRGYADFNLESTQLSISPSRQDLFITANVSEGEKYTISDVKVTGETVLPQEDVDKMVPVRAGQTFSRALIQRTTESLEMVLANIGFAFAEVTPIPDIDREKHTVAMNFVVKPGPRVTVRRIIFRGNASTADEVLRREMRQFEGAWYSQAMLDRSKIRLRRLGYFETVEIETPEVPGHRDQVDVVVTVKERNAGSFAFGVGYSQTAGIVTSVQLTQSNFLGTGSRFSLGLQNNNYSKSISFSYLDPYFTDNGVSVGYSLSYSNYNRSNTTTARYGSGNAAAEAIFGIPISENTTISSALGIFRNEITTYDNSTPPSVIHYLVQTLGDRARNTILVPDFTDDDLLSTTPVENDNPPGGDLDPFVEVMGNQRVWVVNAWSLRGSWSYDTRNDYLLPSRGTLHRLNVEASLPGSDLEYYRLNYDFEHYWHFAPWVIMKSGLSLGYGDSYGETRNKICYNVNALGTPIAGTGVSCGLPFYKNFYAGGPGSVRGFTTNTLGPTTNFGGFSRAQPLGGAVKTTGTFEFYFPQLFNTGQGSRLSAFIDYGYVYSRPSDFEFNKFRISAGIALAWQSPMGPISISYAIPLDYGRCQGLEPPNTTCVKDEIESLQFTFGNQQ
jgi:outer membrane protein insertion porin family